MYSQKKKTNRDLEGKNKIIEEKNKGILDSINYAKRIQEATLPSLEQVRMVFPESFILYKPKDVVSGDFYWFAECDEKKIIAAVDCTGHGVPGAFMSMIGNAFLNEIVNAKKITAPAEILSELRHMVIHSLKQSGVSGEAKDGMDISLISISEKNNSAEWAGANIPLWRIRDGACEEFNADKRPIGFHLGKSLPFTSRKIELRQNDSLYLFSDGYADQFGGSKGKKFKRSQMKELLSSIQKKPMNEQNKILDIAIENWKGNIEQVDDILVIGIGIK